MAARPRGGEGGGVSPRGRMDRAAGDPGPRRPARGRAVVAPARRDGRYRVPEEVGRRLWAGHPWVWREAFLGRPPVEPTGTLIDILSGNGEFVARAYVDQEHAIAARVVSRAPDRPVHPGAGAIAARFAAAMQLRWTLFGAERPRALRLFAGDSEGLPGVTVDRYGDQVVVQWLSAGAVPYREELLGAIARYAEPSGIYEQRRVRPLAGQAPPEAAQHVWGEPAPLELVVEEAGCRFGLDVTAPLGVGLFPDLRLGRDAVARWASGRRVLNLFSYTGAFSLRALRAGADSVLAVDTAARAHARARRNLELTGLPAERMETLTADAAAALGRLADRGRCFDMVICDPPTFSHGKDGARGFSAARDLADVLTGCVRVLASGGILAAATNSIKVSAQELDRAVADAAARAGAELRIVERVGLPIDFPVAPGFPEGNYLKFVLAARL